MGHERNAPGKAMTDQVILQVVSEVDSRVVAPINHVLFANVTPRLKLSMRPA